jgi:hypothetical protein
MDRRERPGEQIRTAIGRDADRQEGLLVRRHASGLDNGGWAAPRWAAGAAVLALTSRRDPPTTDGGGVRSSIPWNGRTDPVSIKLRREINKPLRRAERR